MRVSAVVCLVLSMTGPGPCSATAAAERAGIRAGADTVSIDPPNVLFIGVDDLRPELNCYGATHIISPNIDGLAAAGVLFERAYCQWAVCMPSRASLLSGLRPDTFQGRANGFRKIVPDVVTMPQHFKNNGYFAQSFGKIYHGAWKTAYVGNAFQDPVSWSVERWTASPQYYFSPEGMARAREVFATAPPKQLFLGDTERDPDDPDQWKEFFVRGQATEAPEVADNVPADGTIADAAIERLRELAGRKKMPPFFLAVGFSKPHLPFVAPKKYWDLYDPEKIPPVAVPERPQGAPEFAVKAGATEVNQYLDPSRGLVSPERTRHLRHGYAACVSYVDAQIGRLLAELDTLDLRENTIVVLWSDHGYKLGDFSSWAKHTNFEFDTRVPLIISAPGLPKGKRSAALVELVDLHPTLSELAGLSIHPGADGESFAANVRDPKTPGQDAAFSQFPKGGRMGYTIRTATHRYTEWRDPKRERRPAIRELYEYGEDRIERVNLADKPEYAEVQETLRKRLVAQSEKTQKPTASKPKATKPTAARPKANPASGLQAGAAAINIDPPTFPVIQNGGFTRRIANKVAQSLFARSLVLEDGEERIAICVVDSCMLDRELCDRAKSLVESRTGIRQDRILISATHTHTAPSVMRALGTPPDPEYPAFLVPTIVDSIAHAAKAVRPAEAGWTVANANKYTNNRRWIYLPHNMKTDPYGKVSVRAMMHPGHVNPDTAGPSGPEDPDLTLLSIRERDGGKPLAVLGNLSQHYMAQGSLSSGYTGMFCTLLEQEFGTPFVGLMSQGTSGDLQHIDYSRPKKEQPFAGEESRFEAYCRGLADLAINALKNIHYEADCELAMAEAKLRLKHRLPDEDRIAWAEPIVEAIGDRLPKTRPEVYAQEVFWILENPEVDVRLQAIRIGDFGIATLPNEVYAITGLKLKLQSPLPTLMNIELANGASGYIPPPEQHHLGGYTTWPARTAGLEVQAEPKMVETLLGLLEKVSGPKRRKPVDAIGTHGEALLALKPAAWWRMSAHSGNVITDATGNGNDSQLEPGYALFLPGLRGRAGSTEFASTKRGNRAVHFAGGRMTASRPELNRGDDYSVSLWLWNAMPHDARQVTGYLLSLGHDDDGKTGEHLGITGKALAPGGRLFFYNGNSEKTTLVGKTTLKHQRWHHVLLVREGKTVRVFLDGRTEPELEATVPDTRPDKDTGIFVGGRSDGIFGFEGKIDEVGVFQRALTSEDNPTFKWAKKDVRSHARQSVEDHNDASHILANVATSDDNPLSAATRSETYKTASNTNLKIHIFNPDGHDPGKDARPAIVFFFGGGWSTGSPEQFEQHCRYLASRGMVAMTADYRVRSRQGTSPKECVADGKSAIRWVRANAKRLGIDPARIAAGGGSAGGHVAAATGIIDGFDDPGDDLSISSKPNALVLFNPVYNNGPGGWGHARVKEYWQSFSPAHNITPDDPPTVVMVGSNDRALPLPTAEQFKADMEAAGIKSVLHVFNGLGHGFFNESGDKKGQQTFLDTLEKMDAFLTELGYLGNKPTQQQIRAVSNVLDSTRRKP